MTTAATTLLGLALPVTGELQGTWGDTVNNSITSLLDTAVAGTTTLSTDGDVTLTTTTLATNQARQAILLCSGARTALRTITAPAQSKIYTVINNTTGGFSVKLVGVGPTTGVTIVAGESALVAWNGSDFIKISNTGGSASFTNVTVSGTTTLSGLTASTALALDASKNVVSVTNTGSGNNVLATSPTLTTPNLGTPSALTLTNATGLPLSTGVTGTLATINGGTGLTSFTANGVVYASSSSALTTGSGLVFNGTNLGLGITPNSWGLSGGVAFQATAGAIASVSTTNLIAVQNAYYNGGWIYKNTGSASYYQQFASTHTWTVSGPGIAGNPITFTDAMTLDASGNLSLNSATANGVGYFNGSKVLTSGSALTFDGNKVNTTKYYIAQGTLTAFDAASGGTYLTYGSGVGELSAYSDNSGTAAVLQYTGSYQVWKAGGSEQMRLTSTGLGIGTSSPLSKLTVAANMASAGSEQFYITGTSNTQQLRIGYNTTSNYGAIQVVQIGTAYRDLVINADGGNLGLGVTPSAWSGAVPKAIQFPGNAAVNAGSALYATTNAYFNGTSWIYQNTDLASYYIQNAGTHKWYNAPSGTAGNAITFTQAMTLTANGDLILGATSAVAKLDVRGNGYFETKANPTNAFVMQLTNQTTTSNNGCRLSFDAYNIGSASVGIPSDSASLAFYTNGNTTERARIDGSGNFAIGNSSPSALLDASSGGVTAYASPAARFLRNHGAQSYSNLDGLQIYWNTSNGSGESEIVYGSLSTSYLRFIHNNAGTFTERMRIDGSGNLLVGTTTAELGAGYGNIQIQGSSGAIVQAQTGAATVRCAISTDSSNGYAGTRSNHPLILQTNNTERARIDSSGNLLVGATSQIRTGDRMSVAGTGTTVATFQQNTNTSGYHGISVNLPANGNNTSTYAFWGNTSGIGNWYLYGNGTTSYSSDERLKKNIVTTRDGYIDDVMKLRVVKYNWKKDDDATPKELGLIAQEVEQVFPGLVQDDINPVEEGGEIYKQVKQSVLPFILLKAIQEQQALITQLTARVAQLEAKGA